MQYSVLERQSQWHTVLISCVTQRWGLHFPTYQIDCLTLWLLCILKHVFFNKTGLKTLCVFLCLKLPKFNVSENSLTVLLCNFSGAYWQESMRSCR